MTREELIALATDPRQYDDAELDWPQQGAPGTPAARFYQDALRDALEGRPVTAAIDIGCGTGHLAPLLRALGARRVVGIEPAARNAAIARRTFPELEVIETGLGALDLADGAFDLAVAVMSFEHQRDLDAAMRRVHRLLAPGGAFALVSGDAVFHRTPRFDVRFDVVELGAGEYGVATHFPFGTIHDLIRTPERILDAASRAGFTLGRRVELRPTPLLFEADPRWRELADLPLGQLFVLERKA